MFLLMYINVYLMAWIRVLRILFESLLTMLKSKEDNASEITKKHRYVNYRY